MRSRECEAFYKDIVSALNESGITYLLGGAYAFGVYTGIQRDTKDLDVFVRPEDCSRVLSFFSARGYKTELYFSHWIGKVYCGKYFIDVIFNSGNGLSPVDEEWFRHSRAGECFGIPVQLCPPEEMIWQKAFVQERERFDGADVIHLIHSCGADFDWERLLRRFHRHWRILLSHLVTYGLVYPSERRTIPSWVLTDLISRLKEEIDLPPPPGKICQGTYLSLMQYLPDLEAGYEDARLIPHGTMSRDEIKEFTKAFVK